MAERINGGRALVVVGAVALIVSLFLSWFEPGRSAWTVFEIVDLLLAAIAVAALAAAAGPTGGGEGSARLALPSRWLPALGAAALIIVAGALINHPPAARGSSPELGAWIALAAAGVLTLGGILSGARVSLVITLHPRDGGSDAGGWRPAPPNPGPSETHEEPGAGEYPEAGYVDEYAETDRIDAEEADPEQTAEVPLPDEAPPDEDERT